MSRFLCERFCALEPYVPGEQPCEQPLLKLNTNESPYPPAPAVFRALPEQQLSSLRLYSDIRCTQLRRKMAARFGVGEENLFFANGSDDILSFAFAAFSCGKRVAFPEISYGFYPVFADYYGLTAKKIPLREDFSVSASDFCGLDCLVVLANPNAPTGMLLPVADVETIVRANPAHVVLIDEAYIDFGGESCIPLTKKYPNLLVVGTFSKSRSLAGARLGYAVGDSALIADLERLKFSTNPYNVNTLTQRVAEAALEDEAYFQACCREIATTRSTFTAFLQTQGFEVLPSVANFVFARSSRISGLALYEQLKARGLLIRHFSTAALAEFNRITIGTPQQMQLLSEHIRMLLEAN